MSINSSLVTPIYYCFDSRPAMMLLTGFIGTKILLCCPLSILVLCLGHQQWRQQCSTKTSSHADMFTYHMAVVELNILVAGSFYIIGTYTNFPFIVKAGFLVQNIALPGEMWFHCLTCVERYLAVVHPIFYRSLSESSRGRIRNISIVCAWLLCFEWVAVAAFYAPGFPIIHIFCMMAFSLLVVSFCSLSVLCVLVRPGPGDAGRDEKRIDQTRQRALHTIKTIWAVLLLWFVGLLVCFGLSFSKVLSYNDSCVVLMFGIWCSLPSSVVLHLLYLHRAGKFPCYNS